MNLKLSILSALFLTQFASLTPVVKAAVDVEPVRLINFFNSEKVVKVDIKMADWDKLRNAEPAGGHCSWGYIGPRYEWIAAEKVTVNGVSFDNVGTKKRSWCGSQSNSKPSLTIKFDEYEDSNKAKADAAFGIDNLVLNNSVQDKSYVRACLAYQMFRSAGVAAPRCNFVNLTVNGKNMGLYVNLQSYKKDFFKANFDKKLGNLYEIEGTNFSDWAVERLMGNLNAFKDDTSGQDIRSLISALDVAESGNWDPLFKKFNPTEFQNFWAIELMIGHWDGMVKSNNNSYAYFAEGKMRPLPWGADQVFSRNENPNGFAKNRLAQLLWNSPVYREQFRKRLWAKMDQLWNVGTLFAEIDSMVKAVSPYVTSTERSEFDRQIGVSKQFIKDRRAQLSAQFPK